MADGNLEYWLAKIEEAHKETNKRLSSLDRAVTSISYVVLFIFVVLAVVHGPAVREAIKAWVR